MLICDTPALKWPAGQDSTAKIIPTLPSGRTLADWDSFVLTIRIDPQWPRSTPESEAVADPFEEGWEVVVLETGTISGSAVLINFTVPDGGGEHRYSMDIWGLGGAAGDVPLVPSTWVTVGARTR